MPSRRGADGRSKPGANGDGGATDDADGARAVNVAALKMIDDDWGATTSSRGADSSSATMVMAGATTTTTSGAVMPLTTVAMLDAAQLAAQQRKDEMSRKRKSTLPNGERKPYYCFSCKQALKPEDFDPGLETCRICLAKRRAKDREKKRLRAMQLKHHLLSADEKEVAAFLLGVYHPAVHRPPDNPRQMHMQVSVNVTEFVEELKDLLRGKSHEQADSVVSQFLGRKPVSKSRKSSVNGAKTKIAGYGAVKKNDDDVAMSIAFAKSPTKVATQKRQKKVSVTAALIEPQVDSVSLSAEDAAFTYDIDAVFQRYTSVLDKSMDQTWVRFAREEETFANGSHDIGVDVKYTQAVHNQEQEGSHKSSQSAQGALTSATDEIFSSIMHGADPMVSDFLLEFLFSPPEGGAHMEGTNEPAACSFAEASAVDDSRALVAREQASDNYMYNYNMIEEFQQDGSAYTFKGSLVMGWVGGTSGTANFDMLSCDNGVLPDSLLPQALSRDGKIFDARIPDALVPLKETEHLRGFDEELECYPVVNSVSPNICITLPRNSFSEELGIRALHDGKYIECEVLRNEETVDVRLYPNGKSSNSTHTTGGVVLLGVVYLQCFVQSGAAKQLPIGINIPVLLLPNAACAEEVSKGVQQILKFRSKREARQFIVSLGIALQNGDTKSTKFSFVLEMAYILKLKRTLNMLELVASLAKLPSPIGSSDNESESSKIDKEVFDAIMDTTLSNQRDKVAVIYKPLACLAVGLVHLVASPSTLEHTTLNAAYAFIILMSAAVFSIALSKRQVYELDVVVFSALFAFSQAALLHSAPSFDSSDVQYRIIAYAYAVVITWLLTLMHSMQSFAGILAANTTSILIFSWVGFAPSTLTRFLVASWPQDMYLPPVAIIVHGIVTHFGLSSLGPMLVTWLIKTTISWYVETNYHSANLKTSPAPLVTHRKRYAHSPERSNSVSQ